TALIDVEITRHERAIRSARHAMSTTRYLQLLDRLDALIASPVPGPDADRRARTVADEGIASAVKRLRKAEQKLATMEPWSPEWVEQVHRIRKRAKAVRYTAGVVHEVNDRAARKTAKSATRIQSLLGDFQDTVVNRTQLQRVAQVPDLPPLAVFILGRLDEREEARGRAAVEAYLRTR
ncbi:MAG: CHAD domain-containing protein, partial [Gordonia sp. (in: high G+C Gram-positive bacteria)]|uniref:CHAD domain-containing protein n=1 Tax=Gordonia sp. (in: high G+C Gram-positive bacteria) TaxID=84139 RepID=UPI003BB68733